LFAPGVAVEASALARACRIASGYGQPRMLSGFGAAEHALGVNIPQDEVVVGVPGYTLRDDNRFWNALLMPFRKQRDYWRRPDGTLVERQKTPGEQNRARLAE
jgi:hypothetical protein